MAKKSFTNNSKSAAAAFFSTPTTQPKLNEKPIPITEPKQEAQTLKASAEAATSPKPVVAAEPSFIIEPNKQKKRDKRISALVNTEEYEEFTRIAKKLGYKNNDLINKLIIEFIKSNS